MSIANAAHCSMMDDGKKWKNPYQTSDSALTAMWDGLEGNFSELFGHNTIESGIVRVDGGIKCTSAASITMDDQTFAYGANGSFTAAICFSGFAIQGRKDFSSRNTSVYGSTGFTFFNSNNSAGARFESYYNFNGTAANDSLQVASTIPSNGTLSFGLAATIGQVVKMGGPMIRGRGRARCIETTLPPII